MPSLIDFRRHSSYALHLWRVSEDEAFLKGIVNLNSKTTKKINLYKSSIHRKQKLAVHALLHELFSDNYELIYSDKGKPGLLINNNKINISISHSSDYVAIIIGEGSNMGIDIQKRNLNIARIAPKYLSESEIAPIRSLQDYEARLHIIWGVKECVYKFVHDSGVIYKEINVIPFDITNGKISATYKKFKLEFNFDIFDEYYLVYLIT